VEVAGFQEREKHTSRSFLSSGFLPALNSHNAYEDRGYWFSDNASSRRIALSHFGLLAFEYGVAIVLYAITR